MIPMSKWFAAVCLVAYGVVSILTNPWFWISGLVSVVTWLLFWR